VSSLSLWQMSGRFGELPGSKPPHAQIVGLYTQLPRVAPSPVVDLNRAVAIAMADGPEAALPLIDTIALAPGNTERRFYREPPAGSRARLP
jgi:predicted RNA polymerase sigma factor